MNKKSTSKFLMAIMIIFILFLVAYMVFGDEMKAGFLRYFLKIDTYKESNSYLYKSTNKFIINNTGVLFFKPLLKLSYEKDPTVSYQASSILYHYMSSNPSNANIKTLLNNLDSKDRYLRIISIQVLGASRNPTLIKHLEPLALNDRDHLIRVEALAVIFNNYHKDSFPFILEALKDKHPEVRLLAVRELGIGNNKKNIKPLIDMLDDSNENVRCCAMLGLMDYNDKEAIKNILRMANDKNPNVARVAISSMDRINGKESEDILSKIILDKENKNRILAIRMLGLKYNQNNVNLFINILNKTKGKADYSLKYETITALGRTKSKKATRVLLKYIEDPDLQIRRATVESLGGIGDKEAIPLLLKALEKDPELKPDIISTLGEYKDVRAIPALAKALQDKRTLLYSMESLSDLGDKESKKILMKFIMKNRDMLSKEYRTTTTVDCLKQIGTQESADLAAEFLPSLDSYMELFRVIDFIERKGSIKSIVHLENLLKKIESNINKEIEAEKKRRLIDGNMKQFKAKIREQHDWFIKSVKSTIKTIREREAKQSRK